MLIGPFEIVVGVLGLMAPMMGFLLGIVVCGSECRLTAYQRQYSRRKYAGGKWMAVGAFYATLLLIWGMEEFFEAYAFVQNASVGLVVAGVVLGVWLARSARHFMALPSWSHCQGRGYDITGNVSGTCPECGYSVPTQRAKVGERAAPGKGDGTETRKG